MKGPAVRVYVDGQGVDVHADATALDAVRVADPALAALIAAGERALTDSRGVLIASDTRVHGGAIYRVVSSRARPADGAAS